MKKKKPFSLIIQYNYSKFFKFYTTSNATLEKISQVACQYFSNGVGLRTIFILKTFIFIHVHVAQGYKLDKYTKYENVLSQCLDGVKKRIISVTICFMFISGFHSSVLIQVISFVGDRFSYFLLFEHSLRVASHSCQTGFS